MDNRLHKAKGSTVCRKKRRKHEVNCDISLLFDVFLNMINILDSLEGGGEMEESMHEISIM
jgi:hypothetical protein